MAGPKGAKKHLDALEKKGYIKKQPGSPRAIEIKGSDSTNPSRVPILGRIRAGLPTLAVEDIEGFLTLDESLLLSNKGFLLRVVGDSMIEAHIIEGDYVLVQPQMDVQSGEIVVALINDEATIKRFYQEANRIRLEPANVNMQPILIDRDDPSLNIIGKVVGLIRNLRSTRQTFTERRVRH
jgi:repressor LexA